MIFQLRGEILSAGPRGQLSYVGFTEDAEGNFKGAQTRSFNGDVANETIGGTVSVNSDCTGTATISVFLNSALERTTTLDVVYVDNERSLRGIFTTLTPGPVPTVITVDGRKINPD